MTYKIKVQIIYQRMPFEYLHVILLLKYLTQKDKCILSICNKQLNGILKDHIIKEDCMKEYLTIHCNYSPSDSISLKILFVITYELLNNVSYNDNVKYYDRMQKKARKFICKHGFHSYDPDIDLRKNDMCYGICHYLWFTIGIKRLHICILRQVPNSLDCMQAYVNFCDGSDEILFGTFDFSSMHKNIVKHYNTQKKVCCYGNKHEWLSCFLRET